MQKNKKTKVTRSKKSESNTSALLIPGGLILGMGAGFIFNNLPAGLFIGLGAGMVVFAILNFIRK